MISANILTRLAVLSLSKKAFQEVLAIIAEIIRGSEKQALVDEERRNVQKERVKRYRDRHRNVTVTDTVTLQDTLQKPKKEISPTPPKERILTYLSSSATSLEKQERSEFVSLAKCGWPKDFREQFWAKYPRKIGKKAAFRKLETIAKSQEIEFETLLSAVARIAGSVTDPKFIPHPLTWLNQGRYLDPMETSETPASVNPGWRPGLPTDAELRAKYGEKTNGVQRENSQIGNGISSAGNGVCEKPSEDSKQDAEGRDLSGDQAGNAGVGELGKLFQRIPRI